MTSYKEFNNSINTFSEELTKGLIDTDFKKEMLELRKYLHNKKNIEEELTALSIMFELDKEKDIDSYFSNFINVYNTTPIELKENFKEYYEKQLKREYWEEYVNEQGKKLAKVSEEIKGEKQAKFKEFATLITQTKKLRNTKEIALEFGEDLDTYERVINRVIDRYLKDVKNLTYEQVRAIKYNVTKASHKTETVRLAFYNIDEEEQNLKNCLENDINEQFNLIMATQLKITVNLKLLKICKYELDVEQRKQEKTFKFEQLPVPLDFGKFENLTVTNTPLQAELTNIDSETLGLRNKLSNATFKINEESLTNTQDKLYNGLTELELWVLDTITKDIYEKVPNRQFTDKQLVKLRNEQKGQYTPNIELLADIRAAIDKLMHFEIDFGLKSIKELSKNRNLRLERKNILIQFKSIDKVLDEEDNETTYIYTLSDEEPFYNKYLRLNEYNKNVITSNYPRELLYRKIDGTDKSLNNQSLRTLIIRRLAPLKENNETVIITADEIFKAKGVYIDTATATKKEKDRIRKNQQYAKNSAANILDSYKNDYNYKTPIELTGKNRRFIGYKIEPKQKNK